MGCSPSYDCLTQHHLWNRKSCNCEQGSIPTRTVAPILDILELYSCPVHAQQKSLLSRTEFGRGCAQSSGRQERTAWTVADRGGSEETAQHSPGKAPGAPSVQSPESVRHIARGAAMLGPHSRLPLPADHPPLLLLSPSHPPGAKWLKTTNSSTHPQAPRGRSMYSGCVSTSFWIARDAI